MLLRPHRPPAPLQRMLVVDALRGSGARTNAAASPPLAVPLYGSDACGSFLMAELLLPGAAARRQARRRRSSSEPAGWRSKGRPRRAGNSDAGAGGSSLTGVWDWGYCCEAAGQRAPWPLPWLSPRPLLARRLPSTACVHRLPFLHCLWEQAPRASSGGLNVHDEWPRFRRS